MSVPYYSIIETAVRRTESFAADNPLRYSNDPLQMDLVIEAALAHPDWPPNEIRQWYDSRATTPIKFNVYRFLKTHYILRRDGRANCSEEIDRQFGNLQTLLSGQNELAREAWLDLRDRPSQRRRSWPVVARMVLRDLSQLLLKSDDGLDQALGKRLENVLAKVLMRPSAQLLARVIRDVSEERHFAERESFAEKLTGLIEEVADLRKGGDDSAPDLETLQDENADLRAALFGLTQELLELQARIDEMKEITKTEAIVTFLSEMNSPTNGYLLDNLVQSNSATTSLLQNGWVPEPPEVEGTVYSLKMLMDYFKNSGVSPIQVLGNRAKVSMEDLSYLHYSGSEFSDEKELKWVEFRSSGWVYRGNVISRPRAVESAAPSEDLGG